jgi:hypothetical protein
LTTRGRGKYRRASWARCCSCLEAPKVDRDHRPAPICQMHLIRVGPYISTIEAFQQVRPYILHITLHRRRSWREKILPPQSFSHRGVKWPLESTSQQLGNFEGIFQVHRVH